MNIEKLIQIVNFILSKYNFSLNYTKLIKLLYLADRKSLIETGSSITGDVYYSMRNGPVLSTLYDLIMGKANSTLQNIWDIRFMRNGYDLVALSERIPNGELSEWELSVLSEVDSLYHDKHYGDMIEIVHDKNVCPEWENTENSSKLINIETILASAGWSKEDIEYWASENKVFAEEEKIFASLGD